MAEAGTIDSLQIEIEASSTAAVRQINNLTNALKKLKVATDSGLNLGKFKQELGKLGNNEYTKIEKLAQALQGLKNVKLDEKIGNSMLKIAEACELIEQNHIDKLTKFGNALQTIKTVSVKGYDKLPAAILNIAAAVDSITDDSIARLFRLTLALSRLRGIDFSGLGTVLRAQNAANRAKRKTGNKAENDRTSDVGGESAEDELEESAKKAVAWKNVSSAIAGVIKNDLSTAIQPLVSFIKRLHTVLLQLPLKAVGGAFKALASGMKSATAAAVKFGKQMITVPFRSIADKVRSLNDKLHGLISSFARIMFYRTIRTVIKELGQAMKEGEENAYWYSKTIGTVTRYISEAYDRFASASAMMKNQVGAAWATLFANIEPVINKIVELVSRAAEIVTMFFAKLGGKDTYLKALNYGKEWAETTNDGAEAAKEWRNQLMGFDEINRLEAPDSGKNGNGNDKLPDYGAMFVEMPVESAIGELAEQMKKLWREQDWKGLGELIGNTLNDLWPDTEQWETWGSKLGQMVNGAVQSAYYALKTIDFKRFGSDIAAFINSAIEQIDFEVWGRLLVRKLTAALDFMFGLLDGLKWDKIGEAIGNFFRGALDEATEWLASYNWSDMGKTLWENIKKLVDGFNVPAFARSLSDFIQKAANSAADFINGIDWVDVVNTMFGTLENFIKNFDISGISESIKNLLEAIKNAFINSMTAFGEWLRNKDWKELGQKFNESLQNLLDGLLEMIGAVPWYDIGKAIGDFLGQIDWVDVLKKLAEGLWEAFSGILSGLFDTNTGKVIVGIVAGIETIRLAFIGAKAAGVYAAIRTFAGMVGTAAAGTATGVETAAAATGTAVAKFTPVFAALGESIKAGLSSAATWLTTGMSEFTVAGQTLMTGAAATLGTAALTVSDALLLQYDYHALEEAGKTYNETQTAINNQVDTTLENWRRLYATKGPEVAAEYAKMVVGIDTTGMDLVESQKAIRKQIESEYDDVPKNMWEGFKRGWQYYFGEGSSGGLIVLLEDAFKGAVSGIKKLLGIHSPSTVFKDIGADMIAGLVSGIKDNWKDVDNFFTQTIPNLIKDVSSAWEELKTKTSESWKNIQESISRKASEIKSAAQEKLSAVSSAVSEKWNGIKDKTYSVWESVKSTVLEKLNSMTSSSQNAANTMSSSMSGAFNSVQNTVANTTGQVNGSLNNWNNMSNAVVQSMRNMATQIQQIFQQLVQQISSAIMQIHSMAAQARNDVASINMASSSSSTYHPGVTWHAKGGIIDKATLIGAGEAGSEAIIPLERNTQWIGEVASEMNRESAKSAHTDDSSDDIIAALYTVCDRIIRAMPEDGDDINMDMLARSISKAQRRQARAIG